MERDLPLRVTDLTPGTLQLAAPPDAATADSSLRSFLKRWRDNESSRVAFLDQLVAVPFDAYLWELPALTASSLERPFECVVVDSPSLAARTVDRNTFAEHFVAAGPGRRVVSFSSLGRDAQLIAPLPEGDSEHCVHLARFVREGSAEARNELLRVAATQVLERVSSRPLWLSTNGLGVSWLHVRIDSRPKYFHHSPYRAVSDGREHR